MRKTKSTSPAATRPTASRKSSRPRAITVPRDPDAGRVPDDTTPPRHHSEAGVRARLRGSLEPDSPPARALQQRVPKARGQLDVGTAGDVARPTKTGIAATSIPPRGRYGRS